MNVFSKSIVSRQFLSEKCDFSELPGGEIGDAEGGGGRYPQALKNCTVFACHPRRDGIFKGTTPNTPIELK